MEIDITPYKNEFIELLLSTKRNGMEEVLEDLEENGFYTAPASAGHHLNVPGGLVLHSLNTCKAALAVWEGMKKMEPTLEKEVTRESVIIASLLRWTYTIPPSSARRTPWAFGKTCPATR